MRLECIEFKRCCFCIPLRYGMLVTGYFRLVISILLLLSALYQIFIFVVFSAYNSINKPISIYYPFLFGFGFAVLIILGDIGFTVVYIVGGHKKDPKLMKVYNYYSIVILVLYVIAYTALYIVSLSNMMQHHGLFTSAYFLKLSMVTGLIHLGFQAYVILLTKSEITKLESNNTFRFVNHANEAQCTMDKELSEANRTSVKNSEGDEIIGGLVKSNESGDEIIGTYVNNSKQIDTYEAVNEDIVNDEVEKKNGNYVRLV